MDAFGEKFGSHEGGGYGATPPVPNKFRFFLLVLGDGAFGAQLFETDPTGVVCGNSLFFSLFLRGGAEGAVLFETDH